MARAMCPNPECKGSAFHANQYNPVRSGMHPTGYVIVQCVTCGVVVGAIDPNLAVEVENLSRLVTKIAKRLDTIR